MANTRKPDPRAVTDIDRQIGIRVRTRRLELGISQEALAKAVGVTFQQIQKYERAVNRIAASTLIDIAYALDTSLTTLVPSGESGDATPSALDDPELAVLAGKLNPQGREILLSLARTLVDNSALCAKRRTSAA